MTHSKALQPKIEEQHLPAQQKQLLSQNLTDSAGRIDIGTLLASIKECSRSRNLQQGKHLHARAARTDDESDRYAANSLITMYSTCARMVHARLVFDAMRSPDVVSWTALVQGYVKNNESMLALKLLDGMQTAGCCPNAKTFVAAVSACVSLASSGDEDDVRRRCVWLDEGRRIHARALASGCCEIFLENSLVDMYTRFGKVAQARSVFESMPRRDLVSWNTLLHGCVENSESELALELFEAMDEGEEGGIVPDARTYLAALTACSNLAEKGGGERWLEKGKMVHTQAVRNRCCDIFVETALVIMYAKLKCMVEARDVFDKMARHDIVSWNALLQGYVDNDQSEVALDLFDEMDQTPNPRTYLAAVSACAALAAQQDRDMKWLEKGKSIHEKSVKSRCCNSYVETALIKMYAACGEMTLARTVFNDTSEQSLVFWNSLIQGYIDNEEHEVALQTIANMDLNGVSPDSVTFVAALKACGSLVSIENGENFHQEIIHRDGVQENLQVANCLLDFYSKCGKMEVAKEIFETIKDKDVVSWNSLMGGYSAQGDTKNVLDVFERMREQGVSADEITFSCLLIACSHSGLTDKAKEFFDSMSPEHNLRPSLKHYTGLVDAYGRANRIEEALEVVQQMPFKGNDVIWCSLLAACEKWSNARVGEVACEALLQLNEMDGSAYVLMGNIYKATGMNSQLEQLLSRQHRVKL